MLSMTHSTDSNEKKEIWGEKGAGSGQDPQECPSIMEGTTLPHTHLCRADTNWRASSLLEGIKGQPLRCWAPAPQWAPHPGTYHYSEWPLPGHNANHPGERQLGTEWAQTQPGRGGT